MPTEGYMDAAAIGTPDSDDGLREQLARAMRGTTDGDLLDPGSEIPIGEAERLAYEFIREHFAAELRTIVEAWRADAESLDRYKRLDAIHMRDQLRMIHAVGEALGIDQDDADACVPGCDEGAGGLEHDLHHLIERMKRLREVHVPSEGEDFAFCDACDRIWPCQTASILNGTEQADA